MNLNLKNHIIKIINYISDLEAELISKYQQSIDYDNIYPIIKISKVLTKRYCYYIYFSFIFIQNFKHGIYFCIYFNSVRALTNIIKNNIRQIRPYNKYPDTINYYKKRKDSLSFPSQSIQSTVTIYYILYYYYPFRITQIYFNSIIGMLFCTRIFRGLHYPHDMLVSYLIASLLIKCYIYILYQ